MFAGLSAAAACHRPAARRRNRRARSKNARHATRDELAGIIVEPLVQGAGGMIFHDAAVLRRLRAAADRYDLLLIFDEIFTGFGRTGRMFACEEAGVAPDIVTLSKALTGGTLPLAATVATRRVFDAFLSDDPDARADARPDLHGECAGLRRGQRLARSVRTRAAAGTGGRASRRSLRANWSLRAICRASSTCASGAPSAWWNFERIGDLDALKRALRRGGRLDPAVPQHRLPDARLHDWGKRSCHIDGSDRPRT